MPLTTMSWPRETSAELYVCDSPEDHAILEAEYKKNPKPDKVARASIVSQVSLGEKEVQVRVIGALSPCHFCGKALANICQDLVPEQTPE
jgi:hypothetical protein